MTTTHTPPPRFGERRPAGDASRAPSSRSLWLILIGILAAIAAARVPAAFDFMYNSVPAELSEQLADSGLQLVAVRVAAIAAAVIYVLVLVVYAFVARFLERRVFSGSISFGERASAGVGLVTIAAIALPTQLVCLVFGMPTVPRGIALYAYTACVALAVPLLFLRHGARGAGYLKAIGVSAPLAILLSIQ